MIILISNCVYIIVQYQQLNIFDIIILFVWSYCLLALLFGLFYVRVDSIYLCLDNNNIMTTSIINCAHKSEGCARDKVYFGEKKILADW